LDTASVSGSKFGGKPNWKEYDKQGRLERYYDDVSETFRAFQPVTIDNSRLAQPLADETAALDIGANNIVACTVSIGEQYLYEGATCSNGSATPRNELPTSSQNSAKGGTVRIKSTRCTGDGPDDATMHRMRSAGI